MYRLLVRTLAVGYFAMAISYTTVQLFTSTGDRATLRASHGDTWNRSLFVSKLFDTAPKLMDVMPYYYRASHGHENEDVTVATIVTRPVSAAVHISSTNTTRRNDLLASLHAIYTSSPLFSQWVDIHVVMDQHDRQFNMWRNVARLYARTDWVMMLDVDFAVCTGVRDRFTSALKKRGEFWELARGGKVAFVVPAFEYVVQEDGKDWRTFPRTKKALIELVESRKIAMFHQSWAPGHNSTDYEHYYAAQPGEVYRVTTYQKSYEPYVIMRRDGPPWCDERFIGYGGNKAACLFSIYLSGINFYVLSDDFLIHQSHAYAEETRKNERKINKQVYDGFRKEMCIEQISQSLRINTLHTEDKYNLRQECMKTVGVPEFVLEHLDKLGQKDQSN
ncbi:Glycosyl-transferase for dystroglycan [Rhizoctonia solani]|uniref:Glycosyl-transferase for dystroglycan n=1 Tax=Rhizoctonia solani TaxID=456999 RepID=A0A8H7LHD1_9AGAM|nr:Glycosyl-transferase for dystroglycan [Rhizoctonia solani]